MSKDTDTAVDKLRGDVRFGYTPDGVISDIDVKGDPCPICTRIYNASSTALSALAENQAAAKVERDKITWRDNPVRLALRYVGVYPSR